MSLAPCPLLIKDVLSFLETLVYELSFQYSSRQECMFPLFEVKVIPLPWHSPPPTHPYHPVLVEQHLSCWDPAETRGLW